MQCLFSKNCQNIKSIWAAESSRHSIILNTSPPAVRSLLGTPVIMRTSSFEHHCTLRVRWYDTPEVGGVCVYMCVCVGGGGLRGDGKKKAGGWGSFTQWWSQGWVTPSFWRSPPGFVFLLLNKSSPFATDVYIFKADRFLWWAWGHWVVGAEWAKDWCVQSHSQRKGWDQKRLGDKLQVSNESEWSRWKTTAERNRLWIWILVSNYNPTESF